MPGWWLCRPGTPLGWMLILAALAAASFAMAPQRFGIETSGAKIPNVYAMPNPDNDGDDWGNGWGNDWGDGWIVPPPRREFAI